MKKMSPEVAVAHEEGMKHLPAEVQVGKECQLQLVCTEKEQKHYQLVYLKLEDMRPLGVEADGWRTPAQHAVLQVESQRGE